MHDNDHPQQLLNECRQLREEADRLRRILIQNDINPDPPEPRQVDVVEPQQRVQLTTEQKIALFRAVFRGREDVYAVR